LQKTKTKTKAIITYGKQIKKEEQKRITNEERNKKKRELSPVIQKHSKVLSNLNVKVNVVCQGMTEHKSGPQKDMFFNHVEDNCK
jgi:hypothetical protein